MTAVEVHDDRFRRLIDEDVRLDLLGEGFRFTEGPVWHPDGYLLVSDVTANKRYRWSEAEGFVLVDEFTRHGIGMTFDGRGRLLVCEAHGSVASLPAAGDNNGRQVVVDQYGGRPLNSPNDIVVRSDGAIFFTDPWDVARIEASAGDNCDVTLERSQSTSGVYGLVDEGTHSLGIGPGVSQWCVL